MEPIRILVTEDDQAVRSVTRIALQLEGHLVAEAQNGREALTILAAEDPPQVILLDLAMPDVDGFEFLQAVNAMNPRPATRIVVVTADRTSGLARELLDLGADGFVHKPLRRDDLRHIIELVMTKKIPAPCQ